LQNVVFCTALRERSRPASARPRSSWRAPRPTFTRCFLD
jgi:hypothetical protein